MEKLLLWADDLDDALGVLRHLAPRILPPLTALGLCGMTALALLTL